MKCHKRLTLDIWILLAYVLDITSGGIHQSQPIERHKSFLESSTAQLSAYVAAASDPASSSHLHQHQQQQQQQQPQSLAHSGHQHTGKWEEPYFDDTTPRNVTALVGKSAYLSCRVKNLGNKTVSWIRHRDIHILTVGSYTYTSDQRFQATHHKSNDDWTLQIKWAQKRDAGLYECQISTQPVRSYFVTLSVVVPTATIIGGPDLHVDKGSTINLTCAVKYSPEPPAYIFWYHHDEVISYDSSRGGVSVITEKGDVTTSHLLIQNADLDDSGKYSCSPSNADVASVRVHVLNGEHPEAMQTGSASSYVVRSATDRRLLSTVVLASLLAVLLTVRRQLSELAGGTTIPMAVRRQQPVVQRQHRSNRVVASRLEEAPSSTGSNRTSTSSCYSRWTTTTTTTTTTTELIRSTGSIDHVNSIAVRCVGTLINNGFVLTAAHCVHAIEPHNITLFFGAITVHELPQCLEENNGCQQAVAEKLWIHEAFDPIENTFNVALIQTTLAITNAAKPYIYPICLPLNTTDEDTDQAKRHILRPRIYDATALIGNGAQEACGYSGAPIVVIDTYKLYHVVGVANYPVDCHGKRVKRDATPLMEYVDWILNILTNGNEHVESWAAEKQPAYDPYGTLYAQ
ncbi:uncharacterized protein LOC125953254 [Anopheles darlingi]|nr:uncharacterized protein LOC125953254 [Anopheles darlingi]